MHKCERTKSVYEVGREQCGPLAIQCIGPIQTANVVAGPSQFDSECRSHTSVNVSFFAHHPSNPSNTFSNLEGISIVLAQIDRMTVR